MDNLQMMLQLAIAVSMPFMLFILNGIRTSMERLENVLAEHIKDDALIASRVAVVESKIQDLSDV